MKQIVKILFLVLIAISSCRNRNDNNIKPAPGDAKNNIADTGSISKKAPDNFLIDYTSKQDSGAVYMYCEKMPEFPGGETAFFDYVKNKIKYPRLAVSDKIEGRVVIKFIVKASGEAGDVQIIRSIRSDLDNECIKVISELPKWKPGMINDKPVAVSYSIPVRFLLKNSENLNGIFILPEK
ncbi:MAG: energy transducer TonB [Bacteroidota bacterium]